GPGLPLARRACAYCVSVDLPFLSDILAPAAFVLFLAVVVLLTALLAPTARPARSRIGRRLVSPAAKGILPPVLGFALLLGNASTNLFVGTATTEPATFQVLPAIVVFAGFEAAGFELMRRTTNQTNDLMASMLV